MNLSDFTYNLPEKNIAKYPPKKRGTSKLLVLDKEREKIEHRKYLNIPEYIKEGDIIVLNETKVEKRRAYFLTPKSKKVEILFLNHTEDRKWYCLLKGRKHIHEGDILTAFENENIKVRAGVNQGDGILIEPYMIDSEDIFNKIGHTPIPPYMKRLDTTEDFVRYNTVFARLNGSVASPTASLNLTEDILERIKERGAKIVKIELEIGWGTFSPIREEKIEDHHIHNERIHISKESADTINNAKKEGKRIWAFGTTVARTLESVTDKNGLLKEFKGDTNLYIYPGYNWKCVDILVTNFHMPDSSLILLVSSFAGTELIKKGYKEALDKGYMFLSYGDSMLIGSNLSK